MPNTSPSPIPFFPCGAYTFKDGDGYSEMKQAARKYNKKPFCQRRQKNAAHLD